MKQIKAKIYYEISTGNVLLTTSERQGCVEEFTKEQDFERYEQLNGKNIDEIDFIELEYGTFASTFNNIKSYSVNLETKTLECVYYSDEELTIQTEEQEAKQIISERINTISEYASLDNAILDTLENTIIDYETNLIMGGL